MDLDLLTLTFQPFGNLKQNDEIMRGKYGGKMEGNVEWD